MELGMDVFEMHMSGHRAPEIADRVGVAVSTVMNYLTRLGARPHPPGPPRRHMREPSLKTDHEGYVMLYWSGDPTYEAMVVHRKKRTSVRRCRWAMAKDLGRVLRPDETVHHLNGDRSDDRIENLELRQGAHGPGVSLRCACCGSRNLEPAP